MNILLVVPNQLVKNFPSIDIPLGVLSIAAYLRSQKYPGSVSIYDATLSGKL
jgi:anaerobic magnesium-protoporphyrin IX monomethyl ester cyclase